MARRLIGAFVVALLLAAAMAQSAEAFYIDCSWAFCWPFP